jgi:hypothetical protein
MLTATTDVGTDIFGLQDVVSGYIRKPFNNKELSDRLKAILEDKSVPLAEEQQSKEDMGIFDFLKKKKDGQLEGMEKVRRSAKKYDLRRGLSFVVKEQKAVKSFEIFTDQVTHNIQGLCVTRQYPAAVRQEWGLEETPIIWLSNQLGKVYVNPANIGILGDTIIRFIEKSDDSVIMIDGVEFLIVNNGFDKVLKHHRGGHGVQVPCDNLGGPQGPGRSGDGPPGEEYGGHRGRAPAGYEDNALILTSPV